MKPWMAAGKIVNLLFIGTDEVGPTDKATPAWVLAQPPQITSTSCRCPDPGAGVGAADAGLLGAGL